MKVQFLPGTPVPFHLPDVRTLLERAGFTLAADAGDGAVVVCGDDVRADVTRARARGVPVLAVVVDEAGARLASAAGATHVRQFPRDAEAIPAVTGAMWSDARAIERYAQMREAALEASVVLAPVRDEAGAVRDLRVVDCNERTAAITGRTRAGVLGLTMLEALPSLVEIGAPQRYIDVLLSGRAVDEEVCVLDAGGVRRCFDTHVVPADDLVFLSARDVTARQEDHRQLADRLRFEHAIAGLAEVLNSDAPDALDAALGGLLPAADAMRAFVVEEADAPGRTLMRLRAIATAGGPSRVDAALRAGVDVTRLPTFWTKTLQGGHAVVVSAATATPGDERALFDATGAASLLLVPIFRPGKRARLVGFSSFERTEWAPGVVRFLEAAARILGAYLERNDALAALRAQRDRHEALLAALPDLVFHLDAHNVVTAFHGPRERLVALPADIVGRRVEALSPVLASRIAPSLAEARRTGEPQRVEFSLEAPLRHFEARHVPMRDGEILAVVRDVTAHKQAEEGRRRSEALFTAFMKHSPAVAFMKDASGRQVAFSDSLLKVLGVSADRVLNRYDHEIFGPEAEIMRAHDRQVLATNAPLEAEEYALVDGEKRTFITQKFPIPIDGEVLVGGVALDVTDRRKLEAQLATSDRLATLGTVAAGVAHEINNPLTFVFGGLEVLRGALEHLARGRTVEPGCFEELRDTLQSAIAGAERVRAIVGDLRTLSRDASETGAVELRPTLELALRIGSHEIQRRAQVSIDVPPLPLVLGNASRLGQVWLNLLVNAAQAFERDEPARNRVHVSAARIGDEVRVTVRDNGPGIAPEHLPRLFEPFFTTKSGVGTGLGLPICRDVVRKLGGRIEVESVAGAGAAFHVILPVGAPAPRSVAAPVTRGTSTGRLLVVDDEASIGQVVRRLLRGTVDVVPLTDAHEAIHRIESGEQFDGVIYDLLMPAMRGDVFHDRLTRIAPSLARRSACITGDVLGEAARSHATRGVRIVEKPFELATLRGLVEDLLRA